MKKPYSKSLLFKIRELKKELASGKISKHKYRSLKGQLIQKHHA